MEVFTGATPISVHFEMEDGIAIPFVSCAVVVITRSEDVYNLRVCLRNKYAFDASSPVNHAFIAFSKGLDSILNDAGVNYTGEPVSYSSTGSARFVASGTNQWDQVVLADFGPHPCTPMMKVPISLQVGGETEVEAFLDINTKFLVRPHVLQLGAVTQELFSVKVKSTLRNSIFGSIDQSKIKIFYSSLQYTNYSFNPGNGDFEIPGIPSGTGKFISLYYDGQCVAKRIA